MTTGAALPNVSDLLKDARGATNSPELRVVLDTILASGAASLFEVRTFLPDRRMFAFGADPELWIVGSGQAYVERRTSQGRCLRPMSAERGETLGTWPGAASRPWPPMADAYARAITAVAAAVLPKDNTDALLERCPGLNGSFAFLDLLQRLTERTDLELRAFPGLGLLPGEALAELINGAERVEVGAGETVVREGEELARFYIVLQGALTAKRRGIDGRELRVPATVGNLLAAPTCLAGVPALDTVTADEPTLLAAVSREGWRRLLAEHPMARRDLEVLPPPGTFDLVLVQSDVRDAPVAELTTLLARAVWEDFGDQAAIVHLVRPGAPDAAATDPRGPPRLTVEAATADDVPKALRAALDAELQNGRAWDVLFLHPTAPTGYLAAAAPVLSRVAWLTESSHSCPGGALRNVRADRVALLRPVGDARSHVWPTGTVRTRLSFDVVRRRAADRRALRRAEAGEAATIAGIQRWARALTERLVGLALGGGGSPGFAHIALIRSLEARKIPIDVVAGTSFGALVGAWYAGERQLETFYEAKRLQSMLDAGRRLNLCQAIGVLDTGPLAHLVDRTFDGLQLGDVEMPFFPVSAEVDTGTVYVGRGATLGRAVQMSGAFPPIFPPVIRGAYARLVDGGFVNNVPASVLRTEGASFVVASNSIGLMPPRRHDPEPTRLRRIAAALNPVGRIEDAMRAGMMLFHRVGDAQALFADLSFESAYTGYEFWDFNRGQEVIDQVQRSADAFAERVDTVWRSRRRPPPLNEELT